MVDYFMNDMDKPPSPGTSLLPERDWDKLLTLMEAGQVVPVIGPELLCVNWEQDSLARLYDLWGRALAQGRGLEGISAPERTPLLYRIANLLIEKPDPELQQPGDLEYEINLVIRDQRWPVPESLRQLAEIRDFPLYITTTIDHLMDRALREAGGDRGGPLQILFNRSGNARSCDLPPEFVPGRLPTVFHLFGASCTNPDGFAATEDALIEFSWALIDRDYGPVRLYDFLRGKKILLLGCDFPDWLERFFIHALARRTDEKIAWEYVSDCHQCGLRNFLRRKKARVLPPLSPVDFIAELHQRWQARQQPEQKTVDEHGDAAMPSETKPGAVFLSYAREDKETVVSIRAQLEAANIDTWMDEKGLPPGAMFEHVIHDNIKNASFFLAIISRSLDLTHSNRPGRFVLKEWKWAENENLNRPRNTCFLQPVVVDDTPADAGFIDREFREFNFTYLCDGKLPPEFINFLKQGIRRFRRRPGGVTP
ncbi:MAG: toll/interleukin-1 receptor domain-containing protein [Desulfobacteraceae bacterium]|nr:toll/interleukin-1 receptor domain-containing protein [Desulfobacteraceae bacterium]